MSGHSHFRSIKHKKEIEDKKGEEKIRGKKLDKKKGKTLEYDEFIDR